MNAQERVSDVWRALMRRHGCDPVSAEKLLEELLRAYAEPHRHYHNENHIAELLQLLDVHGGVADGDAVKLAVLFHDAVYDPKRQDNEAASASLAVEQLTALGFPVALIDKVERYVLATQHGAPSPPAEDVDLHLLLDLDLSVLAAGPDRYRAYAQAIRREYVSIPNEVYSLGRRRVLEGFLLRQRIYLTERLQALWEGPARANLASEIASLDRIHQGHTCT
jgi:predicted metal-dependent HD superfamily phosphohydrolase